MVPQRLFLTIAQLICLKTSQERTYMTPTAMNKMLNIAVSVLRQSSENLTLNSTESIYRGFCIPGKIISNALLMYHQFSLRLRDIEELVTLREMYVSHESVHRVGYKEETPDAPHDTSPYAKNRTQASRRRTCNREPRMLGFHSMASAQRFLSVLFDLSNLFKCARHRLTDDQQRLCRARAFDA